MVQTQGDGDDDIYTTWRICGLRTLIFSHLLFEVAPLLFIDQHQVQVVAHRKLLVDVSHRRSQVVASQEQPDGNGLAWDENTRRQFRKDA